MKAHPVIAVVAMAAAAAVSTIKFASAATMQEPAGKTAYEENCRKCHGVRGVPPKTMKAKYEKIPTFNAAFFDAHSEDSVVKVLIKGKGENMKSFKTKLTQQEMVDVAKYIRSFAGAEK